MQEVRVLGKALSCGRGEECPVTPDTKGGKDQVRCMCALFKHATVCVHVMNKDECVRNGVMLIST